MVAYYNEIDPYAAQWLRNLIQAGHIAPGDVDERSIVDVRPDDLRGYDQAHFFAGIGIWSAALRQAGWSDDRPVWTGSCPCQPLSAAGKGLGTRDARHLWPVWFELIRDCRPLRIFGEQVASPDGLAWLDIVCTDLENEGYPVWPIDLCAAGFGAPNIRQRLWFMANPDEGQRRRVTDGQGGERDGPSPGWLEGHGEPQPGGATGLMEKPDEGQRGPGRPGPVAARGPHPEFAGSSAAGELGNAPEPGSFSSTQTRVHRGKEGPGARDAEPERPRATNGFWADCDWIPCTDGKARPVESGTFPLAHVDPQRVGRLRAYGNAINQEVAAAFIAAATD